MSSIRDDLPDGMRVGLFGSGGLSHEPGGKRYFYIDTGVRSLVHRTCWRHDDHEKLLARGHTLEQDGGIRVEAGTAELFAWFVVLGRDRRSRPCSRLGYTAYDNFKCGVGAVRWQMGN